ncbi:MAG: hypothetical protein AAFX39_11985 [Pseudomonadota bacterium]
MIDAALKGVDRGTDFHKEYSKFAMHSSRAGAAALPAVLGVTQKDDPLSIRVRALYAQALTHLNYEMREYATKAGPKLFKADRDFAALCFENVLSQGREHESMIEAYYASEQRIAEAKRVENEIINFDLLRYLPETVVYALRLVPPNERKQKYIAILERCFGALVCAEAADERGRRSSGDPAVARLGQKYEFHSTIAALWAETYLACEPAFAERMLPQFVSALSSAPDLCAQILELLTIRARHNGDRERYWRLWSRSGEQLFAELGGSHYRRFHRHSPIR